MRAVMSAILGYIVMCQTYGFVMWLNYDPWHPLTCCYEAVSTILKESTWSNREDIMSNIVLVFAFILIWVGMSATWYMLIFKVFKKNSNYEKV